MINSVTLLIKNVIQEIKIKIRKSFTINKGIREAIKHIAACPTKQATVEGQAGEKAKMPKAFAQSSVASSPSCGVHVRSTPWMHSRSHCPNYKGFKK